MDIKERIKFLREEQNLSVSALAKKINISRYAIMKWENGESKPSLNAQHALCSFFNVSLDYLSGLSENRNGNSFNEDQFLIAFSGYSNKLTKEQKDFFLELASSLSSKNKKSN